MSFNRKGRPCGLPFFVLRFVATPKSTCYSCPSINVFIQYWHSKLVLMSAKISVIVYILICFEIGILLLILPWTQFWDDNFFLFFLTGKLNATWLPDFLTSRYVRGAVSGLGATLIV